MYRYTKNKKNEKNKENQNFSEQSEKIIKEYENILNFEKNKINEFSIEDLEEGMQKVMDEYAGGISTNYQFNEKQLKLADEKISQLIELSKGVKAEDMDDLMFAYELKDIIEKTVNVDWTKKESIKAQMRRQIKTLLRKYNYPPEYTTEAIHNIIEQAEYIMDSE